MKKETNATVDETPVAETEMQDTAAEGKEELPVAAEVPVEQDPWKIRRTVTLQRHRPNEETTQFVSVNDRHFQVPRDGRPHEVPLPVYEVLMNARTMEDYAADRSEALRDELARRGKDSERLM